MPSKSDIQVQIDGPLLAWTIGDCVLAVAPVKGIEDVLARYEKSTMGVAEWARNLAKTGGLDWEVKQWEKTQKDGGSKSSSRAASRTVLGTNAGTESVGTLQLVRTARIADSLGVRVVGVLGMLKQCNGALRGWGLSVLDVEEVDHGYLVTVGSKRIQSPRMVERPAFTVRYGKDGTPVSICSVKNERPVEDFKSGAVAVGSIIAGALSANRRSPGRS